MIKAVAITLSFKSRLLSWFRWYNSFISNRSTSLQTPELDAFFEQAKVNYNLSTQTAENQWQLSRYRWRFDTKKSKIHFEHNKGILPTLTAKAQILGSHFTRVHQWHWAWGTPNVPRGVARDARRLKKFGRRFGQILLYKPCLDLSGQSHTAPVLAAIGLEISGADMIYQGQSQHQTVYFLLRDLKLSEGNGESNTLKST